MPGAAITTLLQENLVQGGWCVKLLNRCAEVELEAVHVEQRMQYVRIDYAIPEAARQEVLHHCGHCTARLHLQGRACLAARPVRCATGKTMGARPARPSPSTMGSPASGMVALPVARAASNAQPATQTRPRTAASCSQELQDLKGLCGTRALTPAE